MTEEEAGVVSGESKPEKKKTSVKVVRRIKSKKSEKSDKAPELVPPIGEELVPQATTNETQLPPTDLSTRRTSTASSTHGSSSVPAPTAQTTSSPRASRLSTSSNKENEPVSRVSSRKRTQRSGSNVFAMFTQNQVHHFKEAFGFIDQDKDGIISKSDIRASFDALGRLCTEKELEEMVSEAPGPINFTMFLSVFGDRIQGTDDEDVVIAAFNQFDDGEGKCSEEK